MEVPAFVFDVYEIDVYIFRNYVDKNKSIFNEREIEDNVWNLIFYSLGRVIAYSFSSVSAVCDNSNLCPFVPFGWIFIAINVNTLKNFFSMMELLTCRNTF